MSTSSLYKGYVLQTAGENSGTWGDPVLNEDFIQVCDRNMGGILAVSVTSSDVVLTDEQSQYLILRLSGTLTGNRLITTACTGITLIENLCTGAFTVTFGNGVGTPVEVAQGARTLVITDATNSPRPGVDAFPPGTRLAFQQTTPPTGWTKDLFASYDNAAIRLTSGTASFGGSVDFTTAFASQTPSGTVGNTAITIDQMPSHQHYIADPTVAVVSGPNLSSSNYMQYSRSTGGSGDYNLCGSSTSATVGLSAPNGGSQAHTHSFSGNAINFAVKYVDFCIGIKL